MKLLNVILVLVVTMALVINIAIASIQDNDDAENILVEAALHSTTADTSDFTLLESQEPPSLRRISRFLKQQKPKGRLTCNKFPRICRANGSPGSDCCKKKCVNVKTNRLNCGMCGNKCKYAQICCRGKCVNPSFNKRHCGGCDVRCNQGELCVYGMCNYA